MASPVAKLALLVVFPTPPFPDVTTMTLDKEDPPLKKWMD